MLDPLEDFLEPSMGLELPERLFVFSRIAASRGLIINFPVAPVLPSKESEAWRLLRRIPKFPPQVFEELVEMLLETGELVSPSEGEGGAEIGSISTFTEAELIEHLLDCGDLLGDADNLLLACRNIELSGEQTQFRIREIKAEVRHAMSNPEATISGFAKKTPESREIEELPDVSPKTYRLTDAGRDRVKDLLRLGVVRRPKKHSSVGGG